MSKKWMAGLLAIAVLLPVALVPADAWAGGRGYHGGSYYRGGGGYYRGGYYRGGYGYGAGFFVGGLALGTALAAPYRYPYYGYPYYPSYYGPSYYYAPPPVVTYQEAPTTYAAPPPVQREVVYAHGKYVLYGDGVSQAWQWVWVPSAPASPPAAPAPPPAP